MGLPAAVILATAAAAAGWVVRAATTPAPAPEPPVSFTLRLGDPVADASYVDISPDGRRVIQSVTDSAGVRHIVARDLGSTEATVIAGTEGGSAGTYSADGRWISFTRNDRVWKVPAEGGPATQITDHATNDMGEGWLPDGSVLVTVNNSGVWRIPPEGGEGTQLTQIDTTRKEFAHWSPEVLPDGRAFLFTNYATPVEQARIEAYEVASGRRTVLAEGAVFPRYAGGRLFYVRGGAIWSVRFDADHLRTVGTPEPVVDDVAWDPTSANGAYDVSSNGTLVYARAGDWKVESRVVWVDREGRESPAIPEVGSWFEPRLSPDGRWIAVTGADPKDDLWLFDVGRRVLTQLTHAPAAAFAPVWMPDSRSIVYVFEDPVYDLHRLTIDASAPDRTVLTTAYDKYPASVSPDGRFVAFTEWVTGSVKIKALSDTTPARTLATPDEPRSPAFSPDGRWIAYKAGASGSSEVYVSAADGTGGRHLVSAGGGSEPRWTKGGREIVYRRGDAMMAVSVAPATGEAGSPRVLFHLHTPTSTFTPAYDVTPDGSRFLMVKPLERPGLQPLEVVVNWVATLDAKGKQ